MLWVIKELKAQVSSSTRPLEWGGLKENKLSVIVLNISEGRMWTQIAAVLAFI